MDNAQAAFQEHASRVASYDPSIVLGQLCWFSISESLVSHADLVARMDAFGLGDYRLPRVPRNVDVFKRACVAAERRRVHDLDDPPDVYENLTIRPVSHNPENVYRMLVREQVDTYDRRLAYEEVAELVFARSTGTITIKVNNTRITSTIEDQVLTDVVEYYKQHNNSLTGHAVRELVRGVLDALQAVCVRQAGSVYFVQESKAADLFKLEDLINTLPGCTYNTLPLLDDRKQRQMLKKAFEDESIEQVDRILGEIADIVRKGQKISPDRYASVAGEYKSIRAKVAQYSDLLDEALEATGSRLEIFEDAIVELMSHVG